MTDEEIEELIEALNHGRTPRSKTHYSMAADALVALKARAEAAKKRVAELREALEQIERYSTEDHVKRRARSALEAKS